MWATPSPSSLVAASFVLPVLDIAAVALRFHARRAQGLPLLADDWVCLPALLFSIMLAVCLATSVFLHPLGYPTSVSTDSEGEEMMQVYETNSLLQWIFLTFSALALGFIKLSYLLFYKRIFCVGKNWFRMTVDALIWTTVAWTIAFCFAFLLACRGHFSAWWSMSIDTITICIDTTDLLLAMAITDFVGDVMIMALPVPMIWSLHLRKSHKLSTTFVFSLGGLAVIMSLTKLVFTIWVKQYSFEQHEDLILPIVSSMFWPLLEVGLALIGACLPTLHFLFRGWSPDTLLSTLRGTFSLHSFWLKGYASRAEKSSIKSKSSSDYSRATNPHQGGTQVFRKVHAPEERLDAYAMRSFDSATAVPPGRILVEYSLDMVENSI